MTPGLPARYPASNVARSALTGEDGEAVAHFLAASEWVGSARVGVDLITVAAAAALARDVAGVSKVADVCGTRRVR